MANWLKTTWNQNEFALLPANNPFTRLHVVSVHNRDHAGTDVTIAKVRSKSWVQGLRKIVKLIKKQCVLCRKRHGRISGQQMGILPMERLQPPPVFYFSAVDLLGPFDILRTHGKTYGALFNCLSSRSIYVDLAEGYDTDSF